MTASPGLVFALAVLAFVSLGLPDTILGLAWPDMRHDFGQPVGRLGLLLAFATAGYQASSFVGGPLSRRLGVGGVLVASSAVVVLSLAVFIVSPVFAGLGLAATLAGLGGGAIDAAINAYAARHFPVGRVAWLHASYGVGATLGPLVMAGVLSRGHDWRLGFGLVAVAIAVMGLAFFRTRESWQHGKAPNAAPAAPLVDSIRHPGVGGSALLFLLYTGLEAMPGAWAYSLLTESRGLSAALAGTAVSLYWGGLTLGRLGAGAIAHRVAPRRLLRLCFLQAPALVSLFWAGLSPTLDLAALFALGFVFGPVFPLLIAATPARVGETHAANAVGIQISFGSLGWAVLPGAAGLLAQAYGLTVIPPFLLASSSATWLLYEILTTGSSRPRPSSEPGAARPARLPSDASGTPAG